MAKASLSAAEVMAGGFTPRDDVLSKKQFTPQTSAVHGTTCSTCYGKTTRVTTSAKSEKTGRTIHTTYAVHNEPPKHPHKPRDLFDS